MDTKDYGQIISIISDKLSREFLSREKDLDKRTLTLDADIAEIMRMIGKETTRQIYEAILEKHVDQKRSEGLVIKRHPKIRFNVIFGPIEIGSPYLWREGGHSKPLIDEMGITHKGRTLTVNRALSDFGSEDSFERASKRFAEHYKYDLSASTVLRVTKAVALDAQERVEGKLAGAGVKYGENHLEKAETLLIELDGCQIRTATLKSAENTGGKLPGKEKVVKWRDVRIGFARPMDSMMKIYIGRMDSYPPIVSQLFNASVLAGMTPESKVIGIADGGNGLSEELEKQFENLQFIRISL